MKVISWAERRCCSKRKMTGRVRVQYRGDLWQGIPGAAKGVLASGEEHRFEADLRAIPMGLSEFVFIVSFENLFGERFESVTTFPGDAQGSMPTPPEHGFDNRPLD